jgi:hypothetical protein
MAKRTTDNADSNGSGRKQRIAAWRKTSAKGRRGDKRAGLKKLITGKTSDVPF